MMNEEPPSRGRGTTVGGGRSLHDAWYLLPQSLRASSPKEEPPEGVLPTIEKIFLLSYSTFKL